MAENEEKTSKDWLKIILPRVLRAIFWGFIMGGWILLIPLETLVPVGDFPGLLPIEQNGFSYFLFIFIGFEVAIQLLRGTIIQYALGMARALISMIFLFIITNGGIIELLISSSTEVPLPPGLTVSIRLDLSAIIGVFLIFSLLSIIKNLIQAIDFLSERAEEPWIPPEIP